MTIDLELVALHTLTQYLHEIEFKITSYDVSRINKRNTCLEREHGQESFVPINMV
jgi:hypothetical protein